MLPICVGLIGLHALAVPAMYAHLPFIPIRGPSQPGGAAPGEMWMLCGLAFSVIRLSDWLWEACCGRVDRRRLDLLIAYVTFFPTFRLGPIMTAVSFRRQLDDCHTRVSWRAVGVGLAYFALGWAKMLAGGVVVEWYFQHVFAGHRPWFWEYYLAPAGTPVWQMWLGAVLFAGRIYLIFSGYHDLAIGCGRMMGIQVPRNFRWPIACTRLSEFWTRWHMTMNQWMLSHYFLSLARHLPRWPTTWLVFLYTGLWHFPAAVSMVIFATLNMAVLAAQELLLPPRVHALATPGRQPWLPRAIGWVTTQATFLISVHLMFAWRLEHLVWLRRLVGL
jgi:D-alanyl-lipoteichoic acid acyltransferase DltB (MBOAT superfamily)